MKKEDFFAQVVMELLKQGRSVEEAIKDAKAAVAAFSEVQGS